MISAGEVSRAVVEQHLHLCYGMSKDFTLNGLRVGFLHTRNDALLQVGCGGEEEEEKGWRSRSREHIDEKMLIRTCR